MIDTIYELYGTADNVPGATADKKVFGLDEHGEIYRILSLTWSEDNDCWFLCMELDS